MKQFLQTKGLVVFICTVLSAALARFIAPMFGLETTVLLVAIICAGVLGLVVEYLRHRKQHR